MRKYWKVTCCYGHVGNNNEVSVPRFLETPEHFTLINVMELVANMPGVKKGNGSLSAIRKVESITYDSYLLGKKAETDNFFLKNLKTFQFEDEKEIA